MDLKALDSAKYILINNALELLDKIKVLDFLKQPQYLDVICSTFNIKHENMLENMLDILVGEKILSYIDGKYKLNKLEKINYQEQHKFLKEYYPESLEWFNFVHKYSENTLITGTAPELTGFEEEKSIYYWTKIMEQSPYSIRVLAITELYNSLVEGSVILDYGCGSGVGIEQLLELSNKNIKIFGTDPSNKFFANAKIRINKLQLDNKIKINNKDTVEFIKFTDIDNYKGKFDAIFISIIFNHIDQKDYLNVFKKLHLLLKNNGKLVIVQFLDFDKFNRNPIWVMHNIPTHRGYPMKKVFLDNLKSVFNKVDERLNGVITISTK